ncbi:MAG: glucose 1-dehydrogenase [Sphingomonas sp.]|uniref:SDR family NAD(P)-dependent oxidoreductase n=1 Tax=Sphingomonas sp. TaxID=28214 RepID=UPI002608B6C6|nr:glucose 1-dehydrogenase [Sphingomonas sp.]MDK2766580.1 glucose 1-dehydrogenase [Sphingomonas sp.]
MATSDPLAAFRLDGRSALITGPVRGIGLAIARLFAGAGARLVLADVDAVACDALAVELGGISIPTDVGDAAAIARLADQAEARTGGIDILVCNAGIAGPASPLHAMDEPERERLYAINLLHPLRLTGHLARAMATRGRGSIVLLSSIAGLRGNAMLGHYGMTKAALAQLARNLAVEWGPSGVRANAIAPGLIETDWAGAILSSPERAARRLGMTPLRRAGSPDEVAATALYLASDAGGFTTGQTIVVDGGTLISDGS